MKSNNKLLSIVAIFGFLVLLFGAVRAHAFYDPATQPNNKIGIHILHPSEISEVAPIVNSNGGDWGYVTVPIQPSDRDQDKWQDFMHQARDLHLIPIVRITTLPLGGTWSKGLDTDLVDFANFLDELDWPTGNRYIVLFNEVNRDAEWGGKVEPDSYAKIAKNAFTIFKERNQDFFLLGPALDSALPNSATSLSASSYLQAMKKADPLVFTYFDGWASHSYPNPGFSASPRKTGLQSLVSYRTEMSIAGVSGKPVFITETGWDQSVIDPDTLFSYWREANNLWQKDPAVIAFTPFVYRGGSQFSVFSLIGENGELTVSGRALLDLPKTAGSPILTNSSSNKFGDSGDNSHLSGSSSSYHATGLVLKIENFFRQLLGLLTKSTLQVGETRVFVELAKKPKDWETGLSKHNNLAADEGMLFIFDRSHVPIFWMKNMQFPLDIIWIKDGQILSMHTKVPPPAGGELPTYSPNEPVDWVLEVPAGTAEQRGWQEGTLVQILE